MSHYLLSILRILPRSPHPLSADSVDLKLERKLTFSTSAYDFLKKTSYDIL
jgi:hypothetical protein